MLKVQKSLHFIHVKPFLSFCLFVCIALLFSRCDFFFKMCNFKKCLNNDAQFTRNFGSPWNSVCARTAHNSLSSSSWSSSSAYCHERSNELQSLNWRMCDCGLYHGPAVSLNFSHSFVSFFFCITFRLFTIPSNVLLLKNQNFVQFSLILVFSVRLLANHDAIFMFFLFKIK